MDRKLLALKPDKVIT